MAITFACSCGKRFSVGDDQGGKRGKCSACGLPLEVPTPLPTFPEVVVIDVGAPPFEFRLSALERRTNRLAASVSLWRRVALVAVALWLAVAWPLWANLWVHVERNTSRIGEISSGLGGVIEAKGLVIRDEAGRVRASLGYDGDRQVGLKLFDLGKLRSEHRVWFNGIPSSIYYHDNGHEAGSIGGGGGIGASLDMFDTDGNCLVQFDGPNLSLNDLKAGTRFQLGVGKNGVPYMDVFDEKEHISPFLDTNGKPVFYR